MVLTPLSFVALLALAVPPASDLLAPRIAELAALGFEVEPEGLTLEVLSPSACLQVIDGEQNVMFRPGHFEALWHVYKAMGLELGPQPEACRAHVVRVLSTTFVAFYDFERGRMVAIDSALGQLGRNDQTLLHELVHAWQDQQRPLEEIYREGARTFDELRVKQLLVEGQAEAISLDAMLRRDGESLMDLDPDVLDDQLMKLTSGAGVASIYTNGRRYVMEQLREDPDFHARALTDRPPSTEQVLHAEKLGVDEPVELEHLDWPGDWQPARLVQDDTLGELVIFSVLAEAGLPERDAWRAAIGWDGDRLRLWRGEGEHLLAWRLVFDRELDAEQFAEAWSRFPAARVRRDGRAVSWAFGNQPEHVASMLERMAALPVPAAGAEDAATTVAAEAELAPADDAPTLSGGRWQLTEVGLTVPCPDGWELVERNGTAFLMAPARGGFQDNLNALVQPNPYGTDLEKLMQANREFFESSPVFRLHTIDQREVDGMDALYVTYGGAVAGRNLEFRALVLPEERRQIVVTGTILASRAQELAPIVDRVLLGTRRMR